MVRPAVPLPITSFNVTPFAGTIVVVPTPRIITEISVLLAKLTEDSKGMLTVLGRALVIHTDLPASVRTKV